MRNKKAKKLRSQVYKGVYSPKEVQYRKLENGQLIAVGRRSDYKKLKNT